MRLFYYIINFLSRDGSFSVSAAKPPQKIKRAVFLFLLLFFFVPFPAKTQAPGVIISEVAWMGNEDGWRFEWIELYNDSQKETNISGWSLQNAGQKNTSLIFGQNALIPAKGYFLICRIAESYCDSVDAKMSLNNDYRQNGSLILKDFSGSIVDRAPEPKNGNWPAGDNETKQTMERLLPISAGEDYAQWINSLKPGGSPKQASGNPAADPLPGKAQISEKTEFSGPNVLINEIMPSPDGPDSDNEWIEFFNPGNAALDISGWKISDGAGAVSYYIFPEKTVLAPHGFLVMSRRDTKICLNNDGDSLILTRSDGSLAEQVIFGKAAQGKSYAKSDVEWSWSSSPTPGAANALFSDITPKENVVPKSLVLAVKTPVSSPKPAIPASASALAGLPAEPSGGRKTALAAIFLSFFSGGLAVFLKNSLTLRH